jgi:hypothetical protein
MSNPKTSSSLALTPETIKRYRMYVREWTKEEKAIATLLHLLTEDHRILRDLLTLRKQTVQAAVKQTRAVIAAHSTARRK